MENIDILAAIGVVVFYAGFLAAIGIALVVRA